MKSLLLIALNVGCAGAWAVSRFGHRTLRSTTRVGVSSAEVKAGELPPGLKISTSVPVNKLISMVSSCISQTQSHIL